jgi:subtilisin family serine protease
MRRALVLAAVVAGALAASGPAQAVRYAVGLDRGANVEAVAAAVERQVGSRPERLAPIPALVVEAPSRAALVRIPGVRYVEPLAERRLALTPTDPLVSKQWYLTQSRFYEPWLTLPALEPVPVAVIDSGVDVSHPELAGRILAAKSFVGGQPGTDTLGHGTFVASSPRASGTGSASPGSLPRRSSSSRRS